MTNYADLPTYKDDARGILRFVVVGPSSEESRNDLSYPRIPRITNKNDTQIVVKFMHPYHIELHPFCAESGCALKILDYQELPWHWIAIAVECLLSAPPINVAEGWDEHRAQHESP
jgi:hypothetical protein